MPYIKRLKKLQSSLREQQISLLFIDSPVDIYYLTGLNLSVGRLCIPLEGEPRLFVDGRYIEQCKLNSPFQVILREGEALLNYLRSLNSLESLGFDSQFTSYKGYIDLVELLNSLKQAGSNPELAAIDNPLAQLRGIKDETEIQALREAGNLGSQGYDFACSLLKEGISEKEIAIELELFWKKRGGERLAFDSIIAFGPNSSMPHYRAGNAKLAKGETVLIDIGVVLNRYHSDMTRTLFFGAPPAEMIEIYAIVKEAQQRALAICQPGTLIGAVDRAARDFISERGYGAQFSHGLGHGVGLEVHEYPTLKNILPFKETPLQKGMVVTVEPGIYLKGIGGVRIENTIAITENGFEDLTRRSTEITYL